MSDKKSTFLERAGAIGANVSLILKDSTPVVVPEGTFKAMASSTNATNKTAFKTLTRWVDVKESAENLNPERFATFLDSFKEMKADLNHTQSLRQAMGMTNLVSTERFYPAVDGGLKEKLVSWLEHNVEDVNGRTIARPETKGSDVQAGLFQESCSAMLLLPFARREHWHHKKWVQILTSHITDLSSNALASFESIQYWKFSKSSYNGTYGESWKVEIPRGEEELLTITIYPVYCDGAPPYEVQRQTELWLKKAMRTNVPLYLIGSGSHSAFFSGLIQHYKRVVRETCERLRFRAKVITVCLPLDWRMKEKKHKDGTTTKSIEDFNWDKQEQFLTIPDAQVVKLNPVAFDFKLHWHFVIHKKSGQKFTYRYDLVTKTWLKCTDTEASLGTIHIVPPELLKVSYFDKTDQKHKTFWSDGYLTDVVFKDCSFRESINANIFMDTFGEFETM